MSIDSAGREALLAELLDQLLQSARRGDPNPLDSMVSEHPEVAAELRELWAAAELTEQLVSGLRSSVDPRDAGDGEQFGQAVQERERGSVRDGDPSADASGFAGSGSSNSPYDRGPTFSRTQALGGDRFPEQFGEYELLGELGRGGMGVVYKALQPSLGRVVALKRVLRGDLASPVDLQRLRAEAAAMAQLDHPHIIPIYEIGEIDGQPFFSMKYLAGRTLAHRLAEGPLAAREAVQLLIPVCRAIAAAHARGVLHRDLKPSNILIDPSGVPHVTDFGLAKRFAPEEPLIPLSRVSADGAESSGTFIPSAALSLTLSGAILGTPSYMAPEQAAGQRGEITPASDIYSLGAVLYQCLTGRPPFQATNPIDLVLKVLEQDPPLPRLLSSQVDRDLEMIVMKCLQKPPELRYANASAFADDLDAWLANEPIAARSTNFGQLLSRMLRETHHAVVLENWGRLWMWHSLALLGLCLTTNLFQLLGIVHRLPYLGLWVLGLGVWAVTFWSLRRRSGPITFVERQIAHVWAASMVSSMLLFAIEALLDLKVLSLSPVLALIAASVFMVKAGILSGAFYIQTIVLFATAIVMAAMRSADRPDFSLTLYGVVSALCFFVPGLKYARQRDETISLSTSSGSGKVRAVEVDRKS